MRDIEINMSKPFQGQNSDPTVKAKISFIGFFEDEAEAIRFNIALHLLIQQHHGVEGKIKADLGEVQ